MKFWSTARSLQLVSVVAIFLNLLPSKIWALADAARLEVLCDQSIFAKSDRANAYFSMRTTSESVDSLLMTIASSLDSRLPARVARDWQKIELPQSSEPKYGKRPRHIYLRAGSSAAAPTIVVFSGSYSTWKNGSQINQTIAILDDNYRAAGIKPNLVAFPGMFTVEMLSGISGTIPYDLDRIDFDAYLRLRRLIKHRFTGDAGILGYSGGGLQAVHFLAFDARCARKSIECGGHDPIFRLGGLSISPPLSPLVTFLNLDRARDYGWGEGVLPGSALTTIDLHNLALFLKNFRVPTGQEVLDLDPALRNNLTARFFNEFLDVDLTTIMKTSTPGREKREDLSLSYYEYFVREGFARDNKLYVSENELNARFHDYGKLDPYFADISAPLLVYFAKDDPVLSNFHQNPRLQPKILFDTLEAARANPKITVFNPDLGGHIGAFYDPMFPAMVNEFFH